jgi:hypothetical protein
LNPPPPHTSHAQQRAQLHADRERRAQYLRDREAAKAQAAKAQLRRVAPGYDAGSEVLQPTRSSVDLHQRAGPVTPVAPGDQLEHLRDLQDGFSGLDLLAGK